MNSLPRQLLEIGIISVPYPRIALKIDFISTVALYGLIPLPASILLRSQV